MRKQFLVAIVLLFWLSTSFADHEQRPVPLAFASEPEGDAVFAMVPAKLDANRKVLRDAYGVAYRLTRDGALKELYRTKGWYSFKVFVSMDGKYLVQLETRQRGHRPHPDHLAIAFYKDGKPLKRYSTAELVKDPDKVRSSVSYYEWLAADMSEDLGEVQARGVQPGLDYFNGFTLHTVDGLTYRFDVTTGEITSAGTTKRQ